MKLTQEELIDEYVDISSEKSASFCNACLESNNFDAQIDNPNNLKPTTLAYVFKEWAEEVLDSEEIVDAILCPTWKSIYQGEFFKWYCEMITDTWREYYLLWGVDDAPE